MSGEPPETIRDRLECRRVAEAFIQRMVANWKDDRAVVEARHAHVGHDTAVAIGPFMDIPFTEAVVSRHGRPGGRTGHRRGLRAVPRYPV